MKYPRKLSIIIMSFICLSWTASASSHKGSHDIQTHTTFADSISPTKIVTEEGVTSQEAELVSDIQESQIFSQTEIEVMPEFPGGSTALYSFISSNLHYPTAAMANGIQGKVLVQFVVNKDGSIVDTKILRSVDPSIDKEALRIVNLMPKWKPGLKDGKPVRVRFTMPLIFRLQ